MSTVERISDTNPNHTLPPEEDEALNEATKENPSTNKKSPEGAPTVFLSTNKKSPDGTPPDDNPPALKAAEVTADGEETPDIEEQETTEELAELTAEGDETPAPDEQLSNDGTLKVPVEGTSLLTTGKKEPADDAAEVTADGDETSDIEEPETTEELAELPADDDETDPAATLQSLLGTDEPLTPEQLQSLVSSTATPGADGTETELPLQPETDPAMRLQTLLGTDEPLTLEQLNSLSFVSVGTEGEPSNPIMPIMTDVNGLFSSELMTEIYRNFALTAEKKDHSFQSVDVVINPEKYTPVEKLITLFDLLQTSGRFEHYYERSTHWGEDWLQNREEIRGDLASAAQVLQNDPETAQLMTELTFKAYKHLFTDGDLLAPYPEWEKLDGAELMDRGIERSRWISDLEKSITENYQKNLVEGGILKDGLKQGKDVESVLMEYNTAMSFYMSVLPDDTTTSKLEQTRKNFADFYEKEVSPKLPSFAEAVDGMMGTQKDGGKVGPDGEKSPDAQTAIEEIFNPSIQAMAESHFKDNAEASAEFQVNMSSLLYYMWSLGKPGGSTDKVTTELLKKAVDERVTKAPDGVSFSGYKDTLVKGAHTLMQSSRAIYSGFNLNGADWTTMASTVLYGTAGLGNLFETVGTGFTDTAAKTLSQATKAHQKAVGEILKTAGTGIGAAAALAFIPVKASLVVKEIQGEKDPVNLAFLSLGLVGDTISGAEAIVNLGMAISKMSSAIQNSSLLGAGAARGASSVVPAVLSRGATLFFGVAGIVGSTLAYIAYNIYQGIKNEQAFNHETRALEPVLQRLIDTPIAFAWVPDPWTRVEQIEVTPMDWESIIDRQKSRWVAPKDSQPGPEALKAS